MPFAAFQKDAVVGHRPTWSMGVERGAQKGRKCALPASRATGNTPIRSAYCAPKASTSSAKPRRNRRRRRLSGPVMRALDVLGLDETAGRHHHSGRRIKRW